MLIAAVEDNHLLRQWPPTSLELKLFDRQLSAISSENKEKTLKIRYVQKIVLRSKETWRNFVHDHFTISRFESIPSYL